MKFSLFSCFVVNLFLFIHNLPIPTDHSMVELKSQIQLVIRNTEATLDKIRLQGNGHLVDAVEYHLMFVKHFNDKLNSPQSITDDASQIEQYHEQIYHRENRILEELEIVEKISSNFEVSYQTPEHLIKRVKVLLRNTEEMLAQHPDSPFAADIEHEYELVEQLIPVFEASTKLDPVQLLRIEQLLARHELTLKRLFFEVIFNALLH